MEIYTKPSKFIEADSGGENLHVDAGYHVVGMKAPDAPDLSIIRDGE